MSGNHYTTMFGSLPLEKEHPQPLEGCWVGPSSWISVVHCQIVFDNLVKMEYEQWIKKQVKQMSFIR